MKKLLGLLLVICMLSSTALASGTGAGTIITNISTNVLLSYDDGLNQYNSTAASFNIADVTASIGAINGFILSSTVDITSLGTPTGGIYKNLIPSTDYLLIFPYLNRGNATDNIQMSATLNQTAARWTVTGNGVAITVNEDQVGTLYVTVNPLTALNYERATLNITVNIVNAGLKNVVSYNVMPGVVSSDIQNGGYGGLATFNYSYVLEAQGVSISILSKTVSWNYPAGYTGTTTKPVPGSQMTYTVVVKNNSAGVATSINLTDKVPANCHLYYTATPSVTGTPSWVWAGVTDNTADQTTAGAVKFIITVPASGTVTANFAVTVD